MNNYSKGYYALLDGVLGEGSLQGFVDGFNEKYNVLNTDGFTWARDMLADFKYSQIEAITNVAVLPDVVDKNSRGTMLRTDGFEEKIGSIPRFAKGIRFDEKIIREQVILLDRLKRVDGKMKETIFNLMYDNTDKLLKGFNNILTHQRDQIISTGVMEFKPEFFPNNVLAGTVLEFGINIMDGNKTEARWWKTDDHIPANEGANSDPIKDLIKMRKDMERTNPGGYFEMSRSLWEDLLGHTKVLAMIGLIKNPNFGKDAESAIAYGGFVLEEEAKAIIEKAIKAKISIRDTKSGVLTADKEARDLVATLKDNFDPKNVAYLPYGKLGEIQASAPIYMGDPAAKVATSMNGRLQLLMTFNERERNQTIDAELTALVVPSQARRMAVKTVTA